MQAERLARVVGAYAPVLLDLLHGPVPPGAAPLLRAMVGALTCDALPPPPLAAACVAMFDATGDAEVRTCRA